jgi:steroid 5-alpha reductase family enzyme
MILTILSIVLIFVTLVYLLAQYLKDSSIMDIFWGIGFIFVSVSSAIMQYLQYGAISLSLIIITILVTIWGLRLSIHIYLRHKSEDPRYVEWRLAWGTNYWWRSYLQIFLLQGTLLVIISSTILAIAMQPPINQSITTSSFLAILIGICVWIVGFSVETIADSQLANHIRKIQQEKKPSSILKTGLWSYTRHPNYLGEAVLWWGIWILSLSTPVAGVFLAILSPLTITLLLRYVSGVPLTEKRLAQKADFAQYAKNTPIFVPKIELNCR